MLIQSKRRKSRFFSLSRSSFIRCLRTMMSSCCVSFDSCSNPKPISLVVQMRWTLRRCRSLSSNRCHLLLSPSSLQKSIFSVSQLSTQRCVWWKDHLFADAQWIKVSDEKRKQTMLRRPPELPRSVNERLNRLATSVFTSTNFTDGKGSNTFQQKQSRIEIDYSSSLPLQMLLYFNVCFFPCWLFSLTFILPCLAPKSGTEPVILLVFAFAAKAIIEFVRLYLGYAGNLAERMPELTAFSLTTIIFQIPLSIFLLIYPLVREGIGVRMPLIAAVEIIYIVFLIFEGIFGVYAVRIMVAAQSSRFHYRQFEEILSANETPSPIG